MKRFGMMAVLCAVLVSGVGCGGPMYLSSSLGDFYAQKYAESPWIWGNILSYGIYGFVQGFAVMADSAFVNPFYFWVKDAKPFGDDKGSTFDHKTITPGKKAN